MLPPKRVCGWLCRIYFVLSHSETLYSATQKWWGIMVSHWMSELLSILQSYVSLSVRISFPDNNLVNITGFSPNGMCTDIVEIWFVLLMDRFRQILTELAA